jgi:hypothetical protein
MFGRSNKAHLAPFTPLASLLLEVLETDIKDKAAFEAIAALGTMVRMRSYKNPFSDRGYRFYRFT